MKFLRAALCLAFAVPAFASWWPKVSPNVVYVNVGETTSVRIAPTWSGLVDYGNGPRWTFCTSNESIAEGCVELNSATPRDLLIYGLAPGHTLVRQLPGGQDWADVFINCPVEPPTVAAAANLRTEIDQPVSLNVISPFADRTIFHWYLGTIGDTSHPLDATGPQLPFRPTTPGQHDLWVNAMTTCSTSSVQFRIDVPPAKRRATRH